MLHLKNVKNKFFRIKLGALELISYLCGRQSLFFRRFGESRHNGIQRPTMLFVGQAEGKRRLRTLSFCAFKLRKFESMYRR